MLTGIAPPFGYQRWSNNRAVSLIVQLVSKSFYLTLSCLQTIIWFCKSSPFSLFLCRGSATSYTSTHQKQCWPSEVQHSEKRRDRILYAYGNRLNCTLTQYNISSYKSFCFLLCSWGDTINIHVIKYFNSIQLLLSLIEITASPLLCHL